MLFLLLSTICFAKSTIRSDLGCTEHGLLTPSYLPKRLSETDQTLVEFLQSSHPLAESSCYGKHEVKEQKPEHFHLLWECYDKTKACLLPTVNVRTLKTLLHFHPSSKVTIWSNSLQKSLLQHRISHPNVEVRRYSQRLFAALPSAAKDASTDIPKYFQSNVESQSHFSDLFRLVVLWKFGGAYVDFDSLWVNSIGSLSSSSEWVPFTRRKIEGFPLIDESGFIEGGILKLQRRSEFAQQALETFPKYTDEIANCWACVGPKHLTNVYIQLSQDSSNSLPELVDSSLVYGDDYYRNNLKLMYSNFDIKVLSKAASTGVVAFHLFTSSGEQVPHPRSTIDYLFKVAGATGDSGTEHIPLGALSQRRQLESSVGYDDVEETVEFEADFDAEVLGKEDLFCAEWELVVQTRCVRVEKGSVRVTHSGTAEQILAANVLIDENGGVDLSNSFRFFTLIRENESGGEAKLPTTTDELATEAPESEASTGDSGGLISQNNTLDLIFFSGFGVLLVIAFYCLYRVWKGPKEQKKLRHLNDISHVQYVTHSTAPITHTPGRYASTARHGDPDYGYVNAEPIITTEVEELKRVPYSNSFDGKYVKRSPQSSYNQDNKFLADEEVYGYNEQHYGRRRGSYSNRRAQHDYDSGVANQYGGGHADDAYGGGHADDAYMGGGATEEAFEEVVSRSYAHSRRISL